MTLNRVTVFGGSGFLGRHVVRCLAAEGAIVRVAVRHPEDALFLKPMGDVGQIVPVYADVLDEGTIAAAVKGVDAVVNAVGLYVQRGRLTFEAVHGQGAAAVARQASAAGVAQLVHVSGIGVSPTAESAYVRSRAHGETLVREAFPASIILRPGVLFGPEDAFFNTLAMLARLSPVLPLIGGGGVRLQPVYVGDVAHAAVAALANPKSKGQTYELGGPAVYTYAELMRLLLREIGRRRLLVPLPFFAAEWKARVLELLPNPLLTRDQVLLLKHDNVVTAGAPGLRDLGIEPTAVEAVLPTYLNRFRPSGGRRPVRLA